MRRRRQAYSRSKWNHSDWVLLFVFVALVGLMLLLWLLGKPVEAHEWYAKQCCGGNDCRPVPCEELVELGNGDWKWQVYTFKREQVHSSHDSKCHICIHPTGIGKMPLCAYIQMWT